jgi:hypothetical protein
VRKSRFDYEREYSQGRMTTKDEFRYAALSAFHDEGLGWAEAVKLARAAIPEMQRHRISRIQAGLVQMAAIHRGNYPTRHERANEPEMER